MIKAQRVSAFRSAIEKIEEEPQESTIDIISIENVDSTSSPEEATVSEVEIISQPANNIEQVKPIDFDILDIFNKKVNSFLVSLIKKI